MLDQTAVTTFAHVKPGDTPWVRRRAARFLPLSRPRRADATGGRVIAQLVKANSAPEEGTGWHQHVADFHIVIMLKGWARFMYEGEEHLVAAGDCVHQRPGITHYLFDYSPDMEYLEVVGPRLQDGRRRGSGAVPAPTPWTRDRLTAGARSELDFQFLDLLRLELRRGDPFGEVGPGPDMRRNTPRRPDRAARRSCGTG